MKYFRSAQHLDEPLNHRAPLELAEVLSSEGGKKGREREAERKRERPRTNSGGMTCATCHSQPLGPSSTCVLGAKPFPGPPNKLLERVLKIAVERERCIRFVFDYVQVLRSPEKSCGLWEKTVLCAFALDHSYSAGVTSDIRRFRAF